MDEFTFAPATVDEYAVWLRKYVSTGGAVRYWYDYPMERAGIVVAQEPFSLGRECGARARNIIVPEDTPWDLGKGLGHNRLFLSDGSALGLPVAVYNDEAFHDLPGYRAGMAVAKREGSRGRRLCGQGE